MDSSPFTMFFAVASYTCDWVTIGLRILSKVNFLSFFSPLLPLLLFSFVHSDTSLSFWFSGKVTTLSSPASSSLELRGRNLANIIRVTPSHHEGQHLATTRMLSSIIVPLRVSIMILTPSVHFLIFRVHSTVCRVRNKLGTF